MKLKRALDEYVIEGVQTKYPDIKKNNTNQRLYRRQL